MELPQEALAKIVQGEEYRLLQKSFASQTGSATVMLSPELEPLNFFSRPPGVGLALPVALRREQTCCLGNDGPFKAAADQAGEVSFSCLGCGSEVMIYPVMVGGVLAGFGCLFIPKAENPLLHDPSGLGRTFSAWVKYVGRKTRAMMERSRARDEAEAEAARIQGRMERLELALWGSGLALWDWNMEIDEVHRSSDWARMQGYDPSEVENDLEAWSRLIHPKDRKAALDYLENFRRSLGDDYESEYRILRKDGSYHWVRERGRVVERDAGGRPVRSVGTMQDINHRKILTEALDENRRRLETLMSNLPGMAYRCRFEQDWVFEFASQGCRELTGFEPGELVNNPEYTFARRVRVEDRTGVSEKVRAALDAKKPFNLVYRIATADGDEKWVSENGVGLWAEDGKLIALEGFISDITSQKEAEFDKLDQAKLEAAMQTAGAACHELNQPLQSLMLRLELCLLKIDRNNPMADELTRMLRFTETMAGITRRLARVTMFRTSRYLGRTRILDLGRKE